MALLSTLDFEDQTAGTDLAPTVPGWSIVGAKPTATTTSAVHGALGGYYADTGSFSLVQYDGIPALSTAVLDFYYTPHVLSADTFIGAFYEASPLAAQLRHNSSGTISIRNGYAVVATTSTTFPVGGTYRLSWRGGAAGQELRVYLGEDDTPAETISGALTKTSITRATVGPVAAVTGSSFSFDTIRVANDWLPPFAPAPAALHTHFLVNGGALVPMKVVPGKA